MRPGKIRDNFDLHIIKCQNCGLVSLSSFDHVGPGHYENSGMHSETTSPLEPQEWLEACRSDDEWRATNLQEYFKGGNLLDFGCGTGGFLSLASTICPATYGIEVEIRLMEFLTSRGLTVFPNVKSLEGRNLGLETITLFHVLEHLTDPVSMLIDLSNCLSAGGTMIVEVPNEDDALLTLYSSEEFQRFSYWSQHLFSFSKKTLSEVLMRAGFTNFVFLPMQRYGLANHLHWLAQGEPGGHNKWSFLANQEIDLGYSKILFEHGISDTLLVVAQKSR